MKKKPVGIILAIIGVLMISIGLSPAIEAASITITSVPYGYFTVTRYSGLTVPISLGSTHSVTVKYVTGPYSSSWFYVEGDGVVYTSCPVIQRGGSGSISIRATNNSSYAGKTVRWTVVGVETAYSRETASFNVCFKSDKYTLTTSVSPSGSGTVSPSSGTYNSGSSVKLTATPSSGYKFDYWTDDASGTSNPITITMNSNKSVTANFSKIPIQYYTLSVSVASGEGTVSGAGQYQSGTSAEIFATPAKDYEFDHWGGDASGSANPTTVVMSRNKTVYAYFEYSPTEPPYYTLYVSVSPPGAGTVTPSSGEYVAGTGATIRATPNTGYEFAYWTGDASGSANPVTITMNSNKSVTAIFNEVIVNKPPTAFFSYYPAGPLVDQTVSFIDQSSDVDGTIVSWYWIFGSGASPYTSSARNPTCVYSTSGTKTVRLTVTDDDGDSDETTKTLTITKPSVPTYTLSTSVEPWGSGSVNISPLQSSYEEGTMVVLAASPASGYEFDRWSGDASGMAGSILITMNSNKHVTANFVEIPMEETYTLTTGVVRGNGSISPSTGTYVAGEEVEISAIAAEGYSFHSWGGDLSGSENPATLVMNSDKHVTAEFDEILPEYVTLDMRASPTKGGSVTITGEVLPMGPAAFPQGTEVTIEAFPNEGWEFDYWSGDATGQEKAVTLLMDSDKSVTAHFVETVPLDGLARTNWFLVAMGAAMAVGGVVLIRKD